MSAVDVTADGQFALSGSEDTTVRLWDLSQGACVCVFTADSPVYSITVVALLRIVYFGTQKGRVAHASDDGL